MKSRNNSILEIVGLGGDNTARRLWKKLKGYHRRSLAETGMYILLPLESYENFCFSIFTYGRGFPRPFCSFPSTMCLHMACFNKQKIEALKLKFSITFKRQQYILLSSFDEVVSDINRTGEIIFAVKNSARRRLSTE